MLVTDGMSHGFSSRRANLIARQFQYLQHHVLACHQREQQCHHCISAVHTSYIRAHAHTHTHTFNGPFSGATWASRYQKGKTTLDFTGARDSEWQWHQLEHMQVCTSLQTDNHASTPPLSFLQAGCPSCRPTNSIKADILNKPTD